MPSEQIAAVENLAPRVYTNHFRDAKIIINPDGFGLTGVVVGDGDLDKKRTYQLIAANPAVVQLNIELDLKCPLDNLREALRIEREGLEKTSCFAERCWVSSPVIHEFPRKIF